MSAPYIVPFNFQPSTAFVITGGYTITSGKYARVVVNLEGSSTFTIGGATALRGTQNSVLASDNLKLVSGSSYTNWLGVATNTNDFPDPSGGAFNETTDQKTVVADYWLPEGTIISGTGSWRAVVTEYSNIS